MHTQDLPSLCKQALKNKGLNVDLVHYSLFDAVWYFHSIQRLYKLYCCNCVLSRGTVEQFSNCESEYVAQASEGIHVPETYS